MASVLPLNSLGEDFCILIIYHARSFRVESVTWPMSPEICNDSMNSWFHVFLNIRCCYLHQDCSIYHFCLNLCGFCKPRF